MKLCSFRVPGYGPQLGLLEGGRVYNLTRLNPEKFSSFNDLLALSEAAGRSMPSLVREAIKVGLSDLQSYAYAELDIRPDPAVPHLILPSVPPEVWAAGVTYKRSLEAREVESQTATIYDKVYAATRPEIFFKSTAARVVGPNQPLCLRSDSKWMVPEPELALVLSSSGTIVGYTVCNDLSSRDIEGENPLYLPVAKIFKNSCSIGPTVLLAEGEPKPLKIDLRIRRGGEVISTGSTSTAQLRRTFGELVSYLMRDSELFPATVLATGTGIVPPDDFTLRDGDVVEIEIEGIGILRNPVIQL